HGPEPGRDDSAVRLREPAHRLRGRRAVRLRCPSRTRLGHRRVRAVGKVFVAVMPLAHLTRVRTHAPRGKDTLTTRGIVHKTRDTSPPRTHRTPRTPLETANIHTPHKTRRNSLLPADAETSRWNLQVPLDRLAPHHHAPRALRHARKQHGVRLSGSANRARPEREHGVGMAQGTTTGAPRTAQKTSPKEGDDPRPGEAEPTPRTHKPAHRGVFTRGVRVLGHAIRTEPWIFGLAVLGAMLHSAVNVGSASVLGHITDTTILPAFAEGATTSATLLSAAALLLAVGLGKAGGLAARRLLAGFMQFRMQARYRRAVARKYLELPLSWHHRHPTGQLLSNANADVEAAWQPLAPLPMTFGSVFMLIIS